MSVINITPLIDILGGTTGATGTLSAVVMAGGLPATRVTGTGVILPKPVEDTFTDGVLTSPLDLAILPVNYYWKLSICIEDICQVYYFQVVEACDFDELLFIDNSTMSVITIPALTDTPYTVSGGTTGTQPTFTGAPLFTGHTIALNDFCMFYIKVDMTNITNFGTGQYFVTLPYASKYKDSFRGGAIEDTSAGKRYLISGYVAVGASTMYLFVSDVQGSDVFDIPFDSTHPVTLAIADTFYINGSYIKETP